MGEKKTDFPRPTVIRGAGNKWGDKINGHFRSFPPKTADVAAIIDRPESGQG